jgi:hypothetical protein
MYNGNAYQFSDQGGTWSIFLLEDGNPTGSVLASGYINSSLSNVQNYSLAADPVPEPASLLLFGTGMVGALGALRRKLFR